MRHTQYTIDTDIIAHNCRLVKKILNDTAMLYNKPPAKMAAVLKADAYGLGAKAVAKILLHEGVDMLTVACLSEAVELRKALRPFSDVPIFVMGHTPVEYFKYNVKYDITTTIFDYDAAKALSDIACKMHKYASVHIKVDTGMNRLGLKPNLFESGCGANSAAGLLAKICSLPNLNAEGIFTHLALSNAADDASQYAMFSALIAEAAKLGISFKIQHVCDSIGLMRYPQYQLDMVRVGAVLYGVKPLNTPMSNIIDIKIPFCLHTRISRLRKLNVGEGVGYDYTFKAKTENTVIATLPIGYADGYKRNLSNNAEVIVNGQRAPVVGLICMDQCNIDVSHIEGVKEGDKVILLGGDNSPNNTISVLEMADWAKTNRNDIICSVGKRVKRFYKGHK